MDKSSSTSTGEIWINLDILLVSLSLNYCGILLWMKSTSTTVSSIPLAHSFTTHWSLTQLITTREADCGPLALTNLPTTVFNLNLLVQEYALTLWKCCHSKWQLQATWVPLDQIFWITPLKQRELMRCGFGLCQLTRNPICSIMKRAPQEATSLLWNWFNYQVRLSSVRHLLPVIMPTKARSHLLCRLGSMSQSQWWTMIWYSWWITSTRPSMWFRT